MDVCFVNPPVVTSSKDRKERADKAIEIFQKRCDQQKGLSDNRWKAWVEMHKNMADALTQENLINFQSHKAIAPQITGGSGRHFLRKISEQLGPKTLDDLLRNHTETTCGKPKDLVCENGVYITITSMRHLFHLSKIKKYFDLFYRQPLSAIEIGGGFGNLARMVLSYDLCFKYYIIDHPILNTIQFFYLTDFFPGSDVAIVDEKGIFLNGSESSKVFLCSMFGYNWLFENIEKKYALFSTMALTEIPKKGQDEYLKALSPSFMYIVGQSKNLCVQGGQSAEGKTFDNKDFIINIMQKYHSLEYNFWGYFFEYIGRIKSL